MLKQFVVTRKSVKMAKTRGGLISSFRTVSNTEASGIFKPNFITALNRDGGFPAEFKMKINSNGTVTTFFSGNTGYVRHGGEWAHVITIGASSTITWYLWGAAGGSGSYGAGYHAGNGGLTYATTTMSAGTYYLYIGEGGEGTAGGASNGGEGGWPNGGDGSKGDASGAGGGGMTMLSSTVYATNMSDSNIIMIAGGGGGTTGYSGHAGHGGGVSGRKASSSDGSSWGVGGTQSAGGNINGAKLVGGDSSGSRTVSSSNDDGGGGGGYYGGGAGQGDGKPGGGGSGYYNTSLTTNQTYTASADWTGSSTLNATSGIVSPPDVNSLLANSNWAGNSDEKYAQGKITTTSSQNKAHGLAYFSIVS